MKTTGTIFQKSLLYGENESVIMLFENVRTETKVGPSCFLKPSLVQRKTRTGGPNRATTQIVLISGSYLLLNQARGEETCH